MDIEQIARVCHEANRALCVAFGDASQVAWEDAPAAIKASAIDGVRYAVDHPDATPEQSYENWCAFKRRDGWTWGNVKDTDLKTHPCLVPYSDLPPEQRAKDHVFSALVRTLGAAPTFSVVADVEAMLVDQAERIGMAPHVYTEFVIGVGLGALSKMRADVGEQA